MVEIILAHYHAVPAGYGMIGAVVAKYCLLWKGSRRNAQ